MSLFVYRNGERPDTLIAFANGVYWAITGEKFARIAPPDLRTLTRLADDIPWPDAARKFYARIKY